MSKKPFPEISAVLLASFQRFMHGATEWMTLGAMALSNLGLDREASRS